MKSHARPPHFHRVFVCFLLLLAPVFGYHKYHEPNAILISNIKKLLCCGNISLLSQNVSRPAIALPTGAAGSVAQASSDSSSFMYFERLSPHTSTSTTRPPKRPPPPLADEYEPTTKETTVGNLNHNYFLMNHKLETTPEPRVIHDNFLLPGPPRVEQLDDDRPYGSRLPAGNELSMPASRPNNIAAYENVHYNNTHRDEEEAAFYNNLKSNLKSISSDSPIDAGLNEKILDIVHGKDNTAYTAQLASSPHKRQTEPMAQAVASSRSNQAEPYSIDNDNDHDNDDDDDGGAGGGGQGESYKSNDNFKLDYANWQPLNGGGGGKNDHKYERSVVIAPVQTLSDKEEMPNMEDILKSVRHDEDNLMATGQYGGGEDGDYHQGKPQQYSINIPPNHEPIIVRFNTYSTPIKTIQNHHKSKPQLNHKVTVEKADRLIHTVKKMVINEINEVIQPIRKWHQIVEPVRETIKTHIATPGHKHAGGGGVGAYLASAPPTSTINAKSAFYKPAMSSTSSITQASNFQPMSNKNSLGANKHGNSFQPLPPSYHHQVSSSLRSQPRYPPTLKESIENDPEMRSIINELINSPEVLHSGNHVHNVAGGLPIINLPMGSATSPVFADKPDGRGNDTTIKAKVGKGGQHPSSMLSVNTIYQIYTNLAKNKKHNHHKHHKLTRKEAKSNPIDILSSMESVVKHIIEDNKGKQNVASNLAKLMFNTKDKTNDPSASRKSTTTDFDSS